MRFSLALVIFRKEIVETLRDRRTLISLVFLPMILYPLFALLMSRMAGAEQEAQALYLSKINNTYQGKLWILSVNNNNALITDNDD